MLSKTACILISGKTGAGKATFSSLLQTQFYKEKDDVVLVQTRFALAIEKLARLYVGWDGKKDERGIKLLQTLGTEAGKTYDPNCWASYLLDKWIPSMFEYPLDVVIINDWNFPNEADYIRENKLYEVFTIRITSLCEETKNDASEGSLTDTNYNYDYLVKNDFDIPYLSSEAILIAKEILKKLEY